MDWIISIFVLLLLMKAGVWALEKLGLLNYEVHLNKKAQGKYTSINPKTHRALQRAQLLEKLYIAREFFLKRGVISPRSCVGTDEDDR